MKQSYNSFLGICLRLLVIGSLGASFTYRVNSIQAEPWYIPIKPVDPKPVLRSISPESAIPGETVELQLAGDHFQSGLTSFAITGTGIKVLKTHFINANLLKVSIKIDSKAVAGIRTIRVINQNDGTSSESVSFRVKPLPNPSPVFSKISPTSVTQGESLLAELSVKHFVEGQSVVLLDGDGIRIDTIRSISSDKIQLRLNVDELASIGRRNIRIMTPGPGGGQSQTRSFTVLPASNPVPSEVIYLGSQLEKGSEAKISLSAKGIRSGTELILPDEFKVRDIEMIPPNALSFYTTVPSSFKAKQLPLLLRNPKPGGGVSDTVYIPINQPPNRVPKIGRVLIQSRLAIGETKIVSLTGNTPLFTDEDGDSLQFRVLIDSNNITAEIKGQQLYLRGIVEGKSQVSIVASDGSAEAISQFNVQVFVPIPNKPPTLNTIPNIEIPANTNRRELILSGITSGNGENQRLTITASSSNTKLIPNPTVVYTSPNTSGSLVLKANPGQTGTAVITVRVKDNGGTEYKGSDQLTRTFAVVVRNSDIKESDESVAGRSRLNRNYPNPFNPTTTIEYTIGETSFVRLGVFDVTGRPVAKLVEREQAAGTYSVNFTADNIPSGMYIYRLEAGKYTETRTMLLVK